MNEGLAADGLLRIGEIMRTPGAVHDGIQWVDERRNFFHATRGLPRRVPHGKGIGALAPVVSRTGPRRPAIVLWVTDGTKGTIDNPWLDDVSGTGTSGTYWGDNKTPGRDPMSTAGNRALLEELLLHLSASTAERANAAPLVVMRRPEKGLAYLVGLALLSGATRELQTLDGAGACWNIRFDLKWVELEEGRLSWSWILDRARLDRGDDFNYGAPPAWKAWLEHGFLALA